MSLYEDLVASWVGQKHDWLLKRPMGEQLVSSLGKQKMFSYCAYDLQFLHFGTSSEVLDHLSETGSGLVGRRHLSSTPATTVCDIAESSVILSSKISPGVSIGEESLVYDSYIPYGMRLGSLSIVVGLNLPETGNEAAEHQFSFMLPDRHCLWEVPLVEQRASVLVFCGLHDNPKVSFSKDGTFCGKPWRKVLDDLCIQDNDLWSSKEPHESCLWNAKIYPILPYFKMFQLATWLMGLGNNGNESLHDLWQRSERISLEELHRSIDYRQMCSRSMNHQAELAAGMVKACLYYGLLGRNIFQLSEEVLQKEPTGVDICREFLTQYPNLQAQQSQILPKSRAHQVHLDLQRACGDEDMACLIEHEVWDAVADETASAVRYGFEDSILKSSSWPSTRETQGNDASGSAQHTYNLKTVKVELPVRVDFVGGWSDTPPWSLERAGCVLNMAITLEGSLPIGAIIETNKTSGIIIKDNEKQSHIFDFSSIAPPFDHDDPFRLVKCALLVTNVIRNKMILSMGLSIVTWANVPRGSGLGTSSILAAAVVKGLLQIIDEDDSNEKVARLVLVLEQLMGTGGGWQDQIGGLYPGIKFTTSFPGIPLRLEVLPLLASAPLVRALQERLIVVFTGQVRLARQVLQKVVTRYLQRDNILISSIKRLIELAKIGREALMKSDIDELGSIMLEAWRLHQELDPYCSNEFVDKLFAISDPYCCGYKLVGAGGGGFALLLTKGSESTKELKSLLAQHSDYDVKVYDWKIYGSGVG
ncbi:kinase [Lithospermum erythrorhizon]|uniref:Kinase n=1 Tax=Lithospermum erythrorhizon TaxID=34254 RepID=A0AAV3PRZ1_LITER